MWKHRMEAHSDNALREHPLEALWKNKLTQTLTPTHDPTHPSRHPSPSFCVPEATNLQRLGTAKADTERESDRSKTSSLLPDTPPPAQKAGPKTAPTEQTKTKPENAPSSQARKSAPRKGTYGRVPPGSARFLAQELGSLLGQTLAQQPAHPSSSKAETTKQKSTKKHKSPPRQAPTTPSQP